MATELERSVQTDLMKFLAKYKNQIEAVMPKHITPDRILKLILGAIRENPKLAQCSPASVLNSILVITGAGLEVRKESAYLVPFQRRNGPLEATPIFDYRGKVELVLRAGQVRDVHADVIYAHDRVKFQRTTEGEEFSHEPIYWIEENGQKRPISEEERGSVIGVYAIAYFKEGGARWVLLPTYEIEKHRARSRAKDDGPWVTDWKPMAMKTAIHVLCKTLRKSADDMQLRSEELEERAQGEPIGLSEIIDIDAMDDTKPILAQSAEDQERVLQSKLKAARSQESSQSAAGGLAGARDAVSQSAPGPILAIKSLNDGEALPVVAALPDPMSVEFRRCWWNDEVWEVNQDQTAWRKAEAEERPKPQPKLKFGGNK